MGHTDNYICPKCFNSAELTYGIGFLWASYDISIFYPQKTANSCLLNIYDELPIEIIKDVHEYIQTALTPTVSDVYYHPYICKDCGKIETHIYFELYGHLYREIFTPKYRCNCGGDFKKIHHRQKNFYCNKCKTKMEWANGCMWD